MFIQNKIIVNYMVAQVFSRNYLSWTSQRWSFKNYELLSAEWTEDIKFKTGTFAILSRQVKNLLSDGHSGS